MTTHGNTAHTFDRRRANRPVLSGGALALLLLLAAAPAAYAQKMAGPGMGGPAHKGPGMAGMMHPGHAMGKACHFGFYLPFADRLNLTPEQMKKLEDVRFQFEKQSISRRAAIATAALELEHMQNTENPEPSKVESAIRDLYQKKAEQAVAAYRAQAEAGKILTPEQRSEAKKLTLAASGMGPHGMMMHSMMGGMGPGMMGGGMKEGGMMGGGMMGGGTTRGGAMGGGMMGGTGQGAMPQATPSPGSAE